MTELTIKVDASVLAEAAKELVKKQMEKIKTDIMMLIDDATFETQNHIGKYVSQADVKAAHKAVSVFAANLYGVMLEAGYVNPTPKSEKEA